MTDHRSAPRQRTRLRPIKLVSLDDQFLEDASARDLSRGGVRVMRFTRGDLPARVKFVDPQERTERIALLVWARGEEAGFRFLSDPKAVPERRLRSLTADFYGVGP